MLNHTKQLLDMVVQHLEKLPDGIKINQEYGFLRAMLAEYCILKLSAEIDYYVERNRTVIAKLFGRDKNAVMEACQHLKDKDGNDIFIFDEISAITQVKNIRNQLIAHNPQINPISIEQAQLLCRLSLSFLEKFSKYIEE